MFENLGRTADGVSSGRDEGEILDGVRLPLEEPTENHEQILMNVFAALKPAMDLIGCRTYVRMAVRRNDIPACELRPDWTYIDDPIVVIEVMSSQSKRRDERLKHPIYWNMPTVRHFWRFHTTFHGLAGPCAFTSRT